MRKLFTIICLCILTSSLASVNQYYGSWKIDNIVYTFTKDSLYIDEIGNEGDCYTYTITDNKVTATNVLKDTFSFFIDVIDTSEIKIIYDFDNEVDSFNLKKIYNYDFEHFSEI